jgi:hypothetical protein
VATVADIGTSGWKYDDPIEKGGKSEGGTIKIKLAWNRLVNLSSSKDRKNR